MSAYRAEQYSSEEIKNYYRYTSHVGVNGHTVNGDHGSLLPTQTKEPPQQNGGLHLQINGHGSYSQSHQQSQHTNGGVNGYANSPAFYSTPDPQESEYLVAYEQNLEKYKVWDPTGSVDDMWYVLQGRRPPKFDERDAIQKKAFTKWVNKHLKKAGKGQKVNDLFVDLTDGHNLISLLEVLSGETLTREKGRLKFHCLENISTCLEFLHRRKIPTVNIRPEDIYAGNPKLTLGLIWILILHFQVSEPWKQEEGTRVNARDQLLKWAQRVTEGYPGVKIKNFTSSWSDGLAFNAILHRHNPSLVDWRSIRTHSNKQRLENSFSLYESEYHVTRLLEPEDVDIPVPDERSLITYVSQLYEGLPTINLTAGQDVFSEYRLKSQEWLRWVRRTTEIMQDRNLPSTLVELKQSLSEMDRFKTDDLPKKLREKQSLDQTYHELEVNFADTGVWRQLDDDLRSDGLDRAWNALLAALTDRFDFVQQHIGQRGNQQDMLHGLHSGIGVVNEKLDRILERIEETESRMTVISPNELKDTVDGIIDDLDKLEAPIDGFLQNVEDLKTQGHSQANDYYRQVFGLHQRRVAYLQRCNAHLDMVGQRSMQQQQQQVVETERYISIRTQVFEFVEECVEYVERMTDRLGSMEFVEDAAILEEMLDRHREDHRDIMDFRHQVDQCIARQAEVGADDSSTYCDLLTRLEKMYEDLRELSTGRMLDLDSLIAFVRSATQELMWINEREEIEVSRDWSDINRLDVPLLKNYYKTLMQEIELREEKFNAVYNQGAALLKQEHPAQDVIQAYLTTMQAQWNWLNALSRCLEVHVIDSDNLKEFLEEARNCEQWMEGQHELITSHYNHSDLNLDDGEKLLRELDAIREMLDKYNEVFISLFERTQHLTPLWQRGERIRQTVHVTALCDYNDGDIDLRREDDVLLLDNSDMIKWLIRAPGGQEGYVPSVVFRIPPPDERIVTYLQRLQVKFESLRKLWIEKHRRVRILMVLNTIHLIRGWSQQEFNNMDPNQRDQILKALNKDVQSLLAELDPNDPLAIRLREELRLANEYFYSLLKQSQKSDEPEPSDVYDERIMLLLPKLDEYWKSLNRRIHEPVPKDMDKLEEKILEHKQFEDTLQALDSEVAMVQELFRQIEDPTPVQRSRIDQLMERWENLWELSKMYVERLKAIEQVLNDLAEGSQIVYDYEINLGSYDDLPSNLDKLRAVHSQLLEMQLNTQQQQPIFDQLAVDVGHMRQYVSRTRQNIADHPDVDRLEDEVQRSIVRWDNVCMQIVERLKTTEITCQYIMVYRPEYDNEITWLNRVEKTIDGLRDPQSLSPDEYQEHLDVLMTEYSHLKERTAAVENVNQEGGKYIREAKTYDLRLGTYRDQLDGVHPSLRTMIRRTEPQPENGARIVTRELEELNRRFSQLSSIILERHSLVQILMQNWRRKQQEEDDRRRTDEDYRKRTEEQTRLRAIDETDRLKRQREEEELRRRAADDEAERLRRQRDDEETRRREEEARRKAEEDRRRAEEEARRRAAEDEAERERQRRDDDEARRRAEEARRRAEEEADRLRQQKEREDVIVRQRMTEDDRRRDEEEARRRDEEEARRRAEEEARRKAEEEVRRRAEEAARRRAQEEEEARRRAEEERNRLRVEEERNRIRYAEESHQQRTEIEVSVIEPLPDHSVKSRLHVTPAGKPVSPAIVNVQLPQVQSHTGMEISEMEEGFVEGFEVTQDRKERAKVTEHEDEMQTYEEWTETRTQFYELDAVKHVQTGEILTFVEAVRQGLLNLTEGEGEYVDIVQGSSMSLEEAVKRGLVSHSLTDCLNTKYGIRDPNTREELSLIEAVQRGIYDPDSRQLRDPDTGELLQLTEAVTRGVISMRDIAQLIRSGILKLPPVQLENAIEQGTVNVETGEFVGRYSHEKLSMKEALRQGYITLSSQDTPMIALALTDTIEQRFMNSQSGEFVDKNSQDTISLREALSRNKSIINLNVREVVNTQDRKRIPISEAIVRGVINTRQGNFTDLLQKRSMTLGEAYEKELIQKPMTLAEINRKDLVDSVGKFIDGGTKKRYTMLEAICEGLIDAHVQHIKDPLEGDVISVAEALERGILDPKGTFLDEENSEELSIAEGSIRGYFVDPIRCTIFDVKAIGDTKQKTTITFNEALDASIILPASKEVLDTENNKKIPISSDENLIDRMLHKFLLQDSGIKGSSGSSVPIIEAIANGSVDTKKGCLMDKNRNQLLIPREAYERGFVSLRGAMAFSALFNVDPNLASTHKPAKTTKRRKSRGRASADNMKSPAEEQIRITLAEAMTKGLIDSRTQRFRQGDQEMSLQEALKLGIIDPTNEWIVPSKGADPAVQETVTEKVTESSQIMAPTERKGGMVQESVNTVRSTRTTETTSVGGPGGVTAFRSLTSGHGQLEVPIQGMHILEAEKKGMLDLETGTFSPPGTDRTLTLEEAFDMGIVRSDNVKVKDTSSGKLLPIIEAIESGMVSAAGQIEDRQTKRKLTFRAGIDQKLVVIEPDNSSVAPVSGITTKIIQFGSDSRNRSGPVMSFTPTGTATYEESQKAWTYDAHSGEVVDGLSGETMSLDDAVRAGKVQTEALYVKDMLTGRQLAYAEACRWGLIDPSRNMYIDKSKKGQKYSLKDAAIQGLITVTSAADNNGSDGEALQTTMRQRTRKVVATKEAAVAGPAAFVDYSLQQILQLGWYDVNTGLFTHPDTKRQLTLKDSIVKGLFNPYESSVCHPETLEICSLLDAMEIGILDGTNGHVVNPTTSERFNLNQAVDRGYIRSGVASQPVQSLMANGHIDANNAEVQLPDRNERLKFHDAIKRGFVDPSSLRVKNPETGSLIDFTEAYKLKIVDLDRGLIMNRKTNEAKSFAQCISSGELVTSDEKKIISSVETGSGALVSTGSKRSVMPQTRVPAGPGRQELVDIGGGKQVLVKVIRNDDGTEKGEYVDAGTGMKFTVQLHGDPYVTQTKTSVKSSAQVQAIELEPHAKFVGIDQVQDMRSNRIMSLNEAQRIGLARVEKKGKQLTKSYGVFRSDLVNALKKGVVEPSTQERLSLQDAIHSKLIDIRRLMYYNASTGETTSLTQAANMGLVDVTLSELLPRGVMNPANNERISLTKAIELGIVNAQNGHVMNPFSNETLQWMDILKPVYSSLTMEGIYDPRKGYAVPVTSALMDGLIDTATKEYVNPITGVRHSVSEASSKGLIDEDTLKAITEKSINDWRSGTKLCLLDAISNGIVDPQNRTVELSSSLVMPVAKASMEGKFPVEAAAKLKRVDKWTFAEALGKGLIDVASNQFTDPDTGKRMTIGQALEQGYIDTGSVESMEGTDEKNLSKVIESEEFDENSGRIRDPITNMYLTFRQAVDRGIIDEDSLIYDTEVGETFTLREASNRGIIDSNGRYIDRKTRAKITLKDAVKAGLLALIASPMLAGQAVSEAVKRRDQEGYRFKIESLEGKKGEGPAILEESTTVKLTPKKYNPTLSSLTLKTKGEAIQEKWRDIMDDPQAIADKQYEFIEHLEQNNFDVNSPVITNPKTGATMSIKDAVDTGLLDIMTGNIVHPESKRHYSIPKAAHIGMLPMASVRPIVESLNASVGEIYAATQTYSPQRSGGSPAGLLGSPTSLGSPSVGRQSQVYTKEISWRGNPSQLRSDSHDVNVNERVITTKTSTSTSRTGGPQSFCADGIHCGSDDEQSVCSDGIHCGTDDESAVCSDGIHCGTDDESAVCSDGIHCGTDDESAVCSDGIHCGTDDESVVCSDGIHCGTDDERSVCSDGIHCGTDDEDSVCSDGIHCGTDDEEEVDDVDTPSFDHSQISQSNHFSC